MKVVTGRRQGEDGGDGRQGEKDVGDQLGWKEFDVHGGGRLYCSVLRVNIVLHEGCCDGQVMTGARGDGFGSSKWFGQSDQEKPCVGLAKESNMLSTRTNVCRSSKIRTQSSQIHRRCTIPSRRTTRPQKGHQ